MSLRVVLFSFNIWLLGYCDTNLSNVTNLSELPEIHDGDACNEGTLYRMDCNTCLCKNKSLLCTKMACIDLAEFKDLTRQKKRKMKKAAFKRSKDSTEKRLIVSDREFLTLPALAHHAAGCVPNKKYKVDCNVCICSKHKNLACDKKMCVDRKTTRYLEAKRQSGKKCENGFETKTCVKCECIDGKTDCKPIEDCRTAEDKLMLSKGAGNIHRLTFDLKQDECLPDIVYKDKCNKCYCQPDKTLRCTNKMCLNYEQAKQLEEQREYLEEHGL